MSTLSYRKPVIAKVYINTATNTNSIITNWDVSNDDCMKLHAFSNNKKQRHSRRQSVCVKFDKPLLI